MTSPKQFEANRRNALLSTGPRSNEGKQRSSRNALRHGLTAETVIEPIEDAEDYKAFEEAITADYAAETALERELILRLASLLWRLRRATSIETGLLQMQGLRGQREARRQAEREFTQVVTLIDPATSRPNPAWSGRTSDTETIENENGDPATTRTTLPKPDNAEVARYFCHLANLGDGIFDRLGRYEAALWRQVRQTVFTLDALQHHGLSARYRSQRMWRRGNDDPFDGDLNPA